MSLSQLAFQIVELQPWKMALLTYGVMVFGAVVGVIVVRPKGVMRGGSFFGLSLLLHFVHKVLSFVMNHAMPSYGVPLSLTAQIFGMLILTFVFGLFFGQLAIARARDIHGRAIFAYIAFIPAIGWLYFCFAESREEPVAEEVKLPQVLKGGWAVLVGLACMLGAYLVGQAKDRLPEPGVRFLTQQEFDSLEIDEADLENPDVRIGYGGFIEQVGLEATLRGMALSEVLQTYEDGTAMLSASALGNTLTYRLMVPHVSTADDIDREGLSRAYCEDADYHPIYEAGGVLKFEIVGEGKAPVVTIAVNQDVCQTLREASGGDG